ncbi:MAG: hypothetical protein ACPGTU_19495 [Myxococcota bacterium]
MKTLLCALLLMFSTVAQAGAGSTHGTATVIEKGEWELGLYAPLRRGFGDDLELSIHPLTAIRSPNIALKKVWKPEGDWMLASRHSLFYPTPLLKTLSKEGTGGIIVADAVIPPIVASDNRIIFSRSLSETTMLSLGGRAMLGVGFGQNEWPSIHMPIAYPRTVAYQDYLATAFTAQLDGRLFGSVFYRLEFDGWLLPLSESTWATETKGMAHWRPSERFTMQAGGTLVAGAYPYGNNWHLLPGFDLIWRW